MTGGGGRPRCTWTIRWRAQNTESGALNTLDDTRSLGAIEQEGRSASKAPSSLGKSIFTASLGSARSAHELDQGYMEGDKWCCCVNEALHAQSNLRFTGWDRMDRGSVRARRKIPARPRGGTQRANPVCAQISIHRGRQGSRAYKWPSVPRFQVPITNNSVLCVRRLMNGEKSEAMTPVLSGRADRAV